MLWLSDIHFDIADLIPLPLQATDVPTGDLTDDPSDAQLSREDLDYLAQMARWEYEGGALPPGYPVAA